MKGLKLIVLFVVLQGMHNYALSNSPQAETTYRHSLTSDTTDTSQYLWQKLPYTATAARNPRLKFETIHLVLGISGLFSDLSSLDRFRVSPPRFTLPISLYMNVPFQYRSSKFFFMAGGDFGKCPAFKALFKFQPTSRLILGIGAGRITYDGQKEDYSTDSEGNSQDLVIGIKKTFVMSVIGINLIPKQLDLIASLPFSSRISTNFEGENYSVRLPGIQVSLLISLR